MVRVTCRTIDAKGVITQRRGNGDRQAEHKHMDVMASKILPLMFGIGLTIGVAQVQSQLLTGTPTDSASPPKHRAEKRTEATPPFESGASSSVAESSAASPTPKRIRRKTTAEIPPSPTPTPVASPTPRKFKIRFPRLFKPKTSPSPSP